MTADDPMPGVGSLPAGNEPPGRSAGREPSRVRPIARRPALAAAVAGGVALLAGTVLVTATASHRDTASRTPSTSGGGQSPANVQTVDYPFPDSSPYLGPGPVLAGPEKPDGTGADALVVQAPHRFSYGTPGDRYPGAVKTKHLALSMDQAGFLSLVDDSGPSWVPSPDPLWSTDTRADGGHADFQTDGNLVVYNRHDQPVWSSGTYGNPGATLVLQADKNLVIYASDGRALWATGTDG